MLRAHVLILDGYRRPLNKQTQTRYSEHKAVPVHSGKLNMKLEHGTFGLSSFKGLTAGSMLTAGSRLAFQSVPACSVDLLSPLSIPSKRYTKPVNYQYGSFPKNQGTLIYTLIHYSP